MLLIIKSLNIQHLTVCLIKVYQIKSYDSLLIERTVKYINKKVVDYSLCAEALVNILNFTIDIILKKCNRNRLLIKTII